MWKDDRSLVGRAPLVLPTDEGKVRLQPRLADSVSTYSVEAQEQARLAALRELAILDTAPEAAFDDFVFLAAAICDVPISLISLVDEDRQWFKAALRLTLMESRARMRFVIISSDSMTLRCGGRITR